MNLSCYLRGDLTFMSNSSNLDYFIFYSSDIQTGFYILLYERDKSLKSFIYLTPIPEYNG